MILSGSSRVPVALSLPVGATNTACASLNKQGVSCGLWLASQSSLAPTPPLPAAASSLPAIPAEAPPLPRPPSAFAPPLLAPASLNWCGVPPDPLPPSAAQSLRT
ncbi:MAG: hypothetical protein QM756_27160 [Polyangiaceae bacterium]